MMGIQGFVFFVGVGYALAGADVGGYPGYSRAIESLAESGPEIARKEGKQGLLNRYRELLAAHPDHVKNVEIEMRMIEVLEWDVPETGEKPDAQGALDAYLRLMEAYDPHHPLMKTVKKQAAQRAESLRPDVAEWLYLTMVEEYGEDDLLQLDSHCRLGQLAIDQGRQADAARFYGDVLAYDIGHMAPGSADFAVADACQRMATAGLIMMAVGRHDAREERLDALDGVLARYPAIAEGYPALVQRFREAIEGQPSNPPANTYSPTVETLLAQLRTSAPETAGAVGTDGRPVAGEDAQDVGTGEGTGGIRDIEKRETQRKRMVWPWVAGAAVAALGIGVLFAGKRRRTP